MHLDSINKTFQSYCKSPGKLRTKGSIRISYLTDQGKLKASTETLHHMALQSLRRNSVFVITNDYGCTIHGVLQFVKLT